MTREIIASGRMLGAEVRGIDLSAPPSGDDKSYIDAAWHGHLVLLFRGQHIGDAQLLAMAEAFGGAQATESRSYYLQAGFTEKSARLSALPGISIISNLDENGEPVAFHAGSGSQELKWHSDNCYIETPPKGSILHALRVPVNGGGHTVFANQYAAYDTLPEATRERLAGLHIKHDTSRNTAGGLRPSRTLPTTREEVVGPIHPLIWVHPETGKKALYLGSRYAPPSSYIVELPTAEGDALLDELWAHAAREDLTWTHEDWRAGDVLMWDNRCAMHARTQIDHAQAREMHRTLIKGEPVIAG